MKESNLGNTGDIRHSEVRTMVKIFIEKVSVDGVKIGANVIANPQNTEVLELEVFVENQTEHDLQELKLEGSEGEAVRLLTLPFFENIRQLGRLKPHQKSLAQLFRFRRNPAGENNQATIIFKLFGNWQTNSATFATSIALVL